MESCTVYKLINVIYFSVCFAGFVWQVYDICNIFFRYDVSSRVQFGIPRILEPPGMTLCHRYVDILDYDKLNKAKNKNWGNDPWDFMTIREIQQLVTIQDILTMTPEAENAIGRCIVRKHGTYELIEVNTTDCYKYFEVTKFFVLEYICYKYKLKDETPFTFNELANTPAAAGQLYAIDLPSSFDNAFLSKLTLHPASRYPYDEIECSTVVESSKLINKQVTGSSSGRFFFTFFTLNVQIMPPPFVTDCYNYTLMERQSRTDCHQRCVKDLSEKQFNMIPFSSIETRNLSLKSLSYNDIMDKVIVDGLYSIYAKCDDLCHRPDCNQITIFTRTNIQTAASGLSYHAFIPSEPSVKVTTIEVLNVTAFVTFLLSTVSTWFGISIFALNPFNFRRNKNSNVQTPKDTRKNSKQDFWANSTNTFGHYTNQNSRVESRHNMDNHDWTRLAVQVKKYNGNLHQMVITFRGQLVNVEKYVLK